MFTHNNLHPGGNHYDTVLLNADNRKMKHNGTLYSTATNKSEEAQSTAQIPSTTQTQAQPQPTNQKEALQPVPAKHTVSTRCDVPAYYKDMAWMENVQVLDLTTGTPAINLDETSQDTIFGTNSPNSTQEVDTTGETDDDMPYMKKGVGFPIHLFNDMEPEEVDKVPGEINHKCWYRMKSTMKDYLEKSSDKRHFLMRTSH